MSQLSTDPVDLPPDERERVAETMATCPFVGSAVANGLLAVLNSADEPLARIDDVVALGDSGGGDLGTWVLKLFALGNHGERVVGGRSGEKVPEDTFSLHFGGSQGAHPGHSGILLGDPHEIGGGRLDREPLQRLTARADENGRLSIDVVGDFIAENLKADEPESRVLPWKALFWDALGAFRKVKDAIRRDNQEEAREAWQGVTKLLVEDNLVGSAGEWGLLFAFLKNSPRSEGLDIDLAEVEAMFVRKRLPEGWETWKKTTVDWLRATGWLAVDAAAAYHHNH